jgi:predicted nucleotidyltransferase
VDAPSDITQGNAVDLRLNGTGLTPKTLALIRAVFQRYPAVTRVVLFGSRAKGTARPESDIDLALDGDISPDTVSRIASDLDDLPLPYRFDIKALGSIQHSELRRHIHRLGIECYRSMAFSRARGDFSR